MRIHEMKKFSLSRNGDVIDLRSMHLTAYGYQILLALQKGITCTLNEFESVSKALNDLGLNIKVEDQSQQEEFAHPPNIGASLAEYILQLVKTRN